ncbi:hypothetical protein WH52_04470 [Tenacibaculum holothuriorum]|uniref:Chromosome segregation protein SMC n=1 Tax=Tenacibaculum holothuriorum TaxID=1635173 RepID=A0A1Y2PEJ8_9FLAO|nr:hypothetical protein [Tenacibaculum holothuriorum]OSY88924.1 hypothetical protein WH52_04470 [Tenacibaculum holothuriorum]
MSKSKIKNFVLLVLLLVLLFLSFFTVKQSNDYTSLKEVFKQEKADLENELDEIIKDYTTVVVQKKSLSKRLRKEIVKMQELKDSVKNLKETNYNLIRRYRKRIASLERENKKLFIKVDSLNTVNTVLAQENTIAKEIIEQKENLNTELEEKNKELEESSENLKAKVAVAGIIKTTPVKAIAMKERSSGKLTSTSRSSRTDAFKINFDLLDNPVTEAGDKKVYIQILDENKQVIAAKGNMNLKNGDNITYSDSVNVDYRNDRISLVSFVLVNRDDINRGKYTISAFVDGVYSGNAVVKLR